MSSSPTTQTSSPKKTSITATKPTSRPRDKAPRINLSNNSNPVLLRLPTVPMAKAIEGTQHPTSRFHPNFRTSYPLWALTTALRTPTSWELMLAINLSFKWLTHRRARNKVLKASLIKRQIISRPPCIIRCSSFIRRSKRRRKLCTRIDISIGSRRSIKAGAEVGC